MKLVFLFILLPSMLHAEVADKIPSYNDIFIESVIISLMIIIITAIHRLFIMFGLGVICIYVYNLINLWLDRSMFPTIILELGSRYYFFLALEISVFCASMWLGLRANKALRRYKARLNHKHTH